MPADTANDNTKDRQRFAAAADMIKVKKQQQDVSGGRRSSTSTLGAIAYEFLESARSPFCSPQPASMETDDTTTTEGAAQPASMETDGTTTLAVVVAVDSGYGSEGEDDNPDKGKITLLLAATSQRGDLRHHHRESGGHCWFSLRRRRRGRHPA
ncbi:hypothetical protein KC318_g8824 [Hortaea werneckii]|nr:hypothetical protein KC334_g8338 [Hortaea werneckii]KAI7008177.1 hypothetical protein KC355_g7038 [Hortaea werneckii]KAI7662516.1 hypothetical protein KC318_g8824 [Hortaea werneckii]